MSIEVSQQLQPAMHLKVTPKQIAANYILQMSSVELQEAIAQELDENPALEMQELVLPDLRTPGDRQLAPSACPARTRARTALGC